MQPSPGPAQRDLMNTVIGHLDLVAQTGCARAGYRARLLLDYMDDHSDNEPVDTETLAMLRRLLQRLQPGLNN